MRLELYKVCQEKEYQYLILSDVQEKHIVLPCHGVKGGIKISSGICVSLRAIISSKLFTALICSPFGTLYTALVYVHTVLKKYVVLENQVNFIREVATDITRVYIRVKTSQSQVLVEAKYTKLWLPA